jgi:serine/threonine-protein kinase
MSRAVRRKARALGVGAIVAGRWRLEQHLGEGGMAEVFRAEDQETGRRVAVKVLRADIATNPEAVERSKREGELLSQLDNPAIVHVETWGELDDGGVFLVMELLEGETLGMRMRRGLMDPAEVAPIVAGTCAGLHAAHARGIVHRDLKPDNVFLCPTEHGLQVKLLDFGISKVYGGEKLTQTGEVLGTPRYMSPEQLGAEPDVDARVDVYALGVIIYEALAGKPPFLGSTPTDLIIAILNGKVAPLRSLRPELPPGVEAVVMRAMSRVRAARFDTAMGLAEAYIEAAGGVAAVRGEQRRGMATRAMGGMRVGPPSSPPPPNELPGTRPPEPPSGSDDVAGNLRLGTFSGLEVSPAPIAKSDARTVSMGAVKGGVVPAAPGEPVRATPEDDDAWIGYASTQAMAATKHPPRRTMPKTRETPIALRDSPPPVVAPSVASAPVVSPAPVGSPAPSVAQPRKIASTALMDASQSMSIPAVVVSEEPRRTSRRGTLLLVIGALLAGAASAGAVIAGLHYYDQHRREAEQNPAADPPVAPPAVREAEPEEAPEPAPPAVAPSEPPAPEATAPAGARAEPTPEPPSSRRRPRAERDDTARADTARADTARAEEPREDAESGSHLPGFGDPAPAASPIQEAQRALRDGQPQRCIEILDEAIRRGAPALALRRRADCYEAAGQRQRAIDDYQRFCRLVPDHPSVGEVRPLLESWGRSCP